MLYSKQSFISGLFFFSVSFICLNSSLLLCLAVVCSLLRNIPLSEYTTLYSLSCWWTFLMHWGLKYFCCHKHYFMYHLEVHKMYAFPRNEIAGSKGMQIPSFSKHYEAVFQNRCNCVYLHQQWRKVPISLSLLTLVF